MTFGPYVVLLRAALASGSTSASAEPIEPPERREPGERDPAADQALFEAARRGDRQAFDELYHRHASWVWARVTLLVGPVAEREDLVQQVFIGVFRALDTFRGDAALSTFIYRIVINVCLKHLRRRRREQPPDPALVESLVDPAASPEAALAQRRELERALALLARLGPKKRIAIVLRVIEGLPLEAIGKLVGANAPAVGQRVKHAQRELAAMVERLDRGRSR